MAGIDLTGPRARVSERVFLDRANIFRDPPAERPTDIDDDTGLPMTVPTLDTVTLATAVPCVAREANLRESDYDPAVVEKLYEISFDYSLVPADLDVGDRVVLSSSDAEIDGENVYVSRVYSGTLRVSRKVEATKRVRASNRH